MEFFKLESSEIWRRVRRRGRRRKKPTESQLFIFMISELKINIAHWFSVVQCSNTSQFDTCLRMRWESFSSCRCVRAELLRVILPGGTFGLFSGEAFFVIGWDTLVKILLCLVWYVRQRSVDKLWKFFRFKLDLNSI